MAKEPNKGPDDKEKDDLFDEGLEEIDIDDLLLDDDTPLKTEESAAPAAAKKEGGEKKPEIIDDGEIDLLADDLQEPAEPVLAEDLIDLEEELPAEPERQTVLETPASSRVESPTNGNPPGLDEEMASSADAKDEDAVFDLLAEDDEAPADVLDDVPAGEPASAEAPDEAPQAADTSEEETAPLPAADPAGEEEAAAPAPGKKLGRLKGGKPLKPAKKEKQAKKGKEEKAPRKPPKERAERPVALPAGARGSITFVCSECYEEFLIPSSYSQEMVSCPECLHVGKRPDDEFLRTVHLHKAGEKRSFLSAIVVGALLFAVALALAWTHTPYGAGQADSGGTLSLALLGAAGLLTVILIWLVVRFEGNRWEVYF
jgi:hypothetical protein